MKNCGNCKWHDQEKFTMGWVCVNAKSRRCTNFTMRYDTCPAWEGWAKKDIEKGYELVKGLFGSLKEMAAGK